MSGDSFQLDAASIKNGRVAYNFICPACNAIKYKPVGGYVKGINTTPDKPADQVKWLIEASILLAADQTVSGDQLVKDTVYIKQYFYSNFVFDYAYKFAGS